MKKILFIEDEAALQKTLGESLRNKGYEVQSATDGEVGLRLATTIHPDLVLLDLVLPKIYGLDVLKKMRQSKEAKDIPVIILTNLENIGEVEKAVELGATTYLIKANYNLDEIIKKIENLLKD